MSITRKMLKGMGLTEDQQDTILEAHTETVNEIKTERDRLKADAEKLGEVQKQLDSLKGGEDYKAKYDTLLAQIEGEKTQQAKEKAARAHLKSKGITDDASLDLAMMAASGEISKLEMDGEKIKDTKGLDGLLSGTLSKLITHVNTQGTNTPNPIANNGKAVTKESIMAIKDTAERQSAMLANAELFGI